MPDFNSTEYQVALTRQFAESLQAISSLTQSVQDLHTEVRQHSEHLTSLRTEMLSLQDRLSGLLKVVQGDGLQNSLTSAVVEIQTKLTVIEQWQRDFRDDKREGKTTNTTVIVLIVTAVASVMGAIMAVIIPILLK